MSILGVLYFPIRHPALLPENYFEKQALTSCLKVSCYAFWGAAELSEVPKVKDDKNSKAPEIVGFRA